MFRIAILGITLIISGCASYTTPGGSVQLSALADTDINELMSKEPAAVYDMRLTTEKIAFQN